MGEIELCPSTPSAVVPLATTIAAYSATAIIPAAIPNGRQCHPVARTTWNFITRSFRVVTGN
ncbi:hypothetical protein [Candidatus Binatus soli]|uniref:hypothetical protein n=1 Tax=Candidatus Binatus soli TaxID=1953413 RepID=UPI003D116EE0